MATNPGQEIWEKAANNPGLAARKHCQPRSGGPGAPWRPTPDRGPGGSVASRPGREARGDSSFRWVKKDLLTKDKDVQPHVKPCRRNDRSLMKELFTLSARSRKEDVQLQRGSFSIP